VLGNIQTGIGSINRILLSFSFVQSGRDFFANTPAKIHPGTTTIRDRYHDETRMA
jgi:hypothetical protein